MLLCDALTQSISYSVRKILQPDDALTVWQMLVIPYPIRHGWSDTILYVQRKTADVWAYWSRSFCRGPQGETLGILGTLFWYASERAQQWMLNLSFDKPGRECHLKFECNYLASPKTPYLPSNSHFSNKHVYGEWFGCFHVVNMPISILAF